MKFGGGMPESVPHVRAPKITLKPAAIGFKPPSNSMMAKRIPMAKPRIPQAIRLKKEKIPNPKPFRYKGVGE